LSTRLDYRGYGPFLPYGSIERILRDAGNVEVAVDPDTIPVLKTWATKRGYYAYIEHGNVITLSLIPLEKEPRAARKARNVVEKAAPQEVKIVIDKPRWRNDVSEKIANVTYIISAVLKAPILYRGSPRSPAFRTLLASKKPMLVRVSLNATDYFMLLLGNHVIAAAQLGAPLTPEQTSSVIEQMEKSDALITIYDVSGLDIAKDLKAA
jgi:energy-converting hydrogenase Eha subunit A